MSFRKVEKGFSLVEMMVVVTIISILAIVAIPNYRNFKAKAIRKEGLNLLSTYYTAATSTRSEFGYFPGNFVQTGFRPVGQLTYRLRAEDGMDIDIGPGINDDLCTRTFNDCDCMSAGGDCSTYKTWDEGPNGMTSGGRVTQLGIAGVVPTSCPGGEPMTSDNSFRAAVAARIRIGATTKDVLSIDHNKVVTNCIDGLY